MNTSRFSNLLTGLRLWIIVLIVLAVFCPTVFAQWTASPGNFEVNGSLRVKQDSAVLGNATVGGNQTVTGTQTVTGSSTVSSVNATGNIKAAGFLVATPSSLTSTNRALLTFASSGVLLAPSDVNGGGPITNTIAAPGTSKVGAYVVVVNSGPTNVVISDVAGTANQSSDTTLGADDAVVLYAVSATKWVQVGAESDN
jgi:hypothetical protein